MIEFSDDEDTKRDPMAQMIGEGLVEGTVGIDGYMHYRLTEKGKAQADQNSRESAGRTAVVVYDPEHADLLKKLGPQ